MECCISSMTTVCGLVLFALLYMISGAMMSAIGIITYIQVPDLFTTGSIVWAGVVIFLCGKSLLVMSVCYAGLGLAKSYGMLFVSSIVLIFSILNIILLETIDWKAMGERKASQEYVLMDTRNNLIIFLAYLFGLLGSIISMTSAFFGSIYIYFTTVQPALERKQKSQPKYALPLNAFRCSLAQKPARNFKFKLTQAPSDENHNLSCAQWGNGDSDLCHMSWMIDSQLRDESTDGPDQCEPTHSNEALMAEIRARLTKNPACQRFLSVTAQVNQVASDDWSQEPVPTGINQSPEPVLARMSQTPQQLAKIVECAEPVPSGMIGQLPPNTRITFSRYVSSDRESTRL